MANALSGETLIINNETIAYMPNSLVYDFGNPEVTVEPQIIGGGAVTNTYSRDFSTAKSKVTFDLKSTVENKDKVRVWINNFSNNLIKIVAPDGNSSEIVENSVVINKPEINSSADGVISIEFEAAPAVKG
jgi:hypothetical protein